MIVNIIPAIRLPRSTGFYSYSVPLDLEKEVKIGQIIETNFRGKNIQGLIFKIDKDKKFKYKLKEINKILFSQVLITKNQIGLIKYISEYYGVAQSVVVKSMIPEIPKRQKSTKTLKHLSTKIKNQNFKKEIFWYADEDELFKELKNKIKNKGQILILVPEIELINKVAEKLNLKDTKYIKNENKIAKGKFFKNWLEILSGKNKIIIGTKISVLLPFSNLEKIIIYNEHDWNHKQSDINPRYDSRRIAECLAKKNNAELFLTTPAPSVESYHLNTKSFKHLNTKNIKLVDLRKEKEKGNYTFLSDELIYNIQANLKNKEKTFLFHNRKGLANYIFCQDCGHILKCPECQISLVYHSLDKKLHCHHCNLEQDVLPLCPKCFGPNINFKGQGVDKIKSELQKEFSNAKILILSKTKQQFNNLAIKQFDIVIGTTYAINKINFNQFNLIAFLNFDQFLNSPDFRAQEKALQLFYEIKSQTEANFLIQTHDVENIVLQSINKNNPEIFYKQELKNRKDLNYPPFVKLIKIIYKDKNEKSAIYNSKKLVLKLREVFSKQIEVLGPFENYPKKVFNKFNYNIILKIPNDFDLQKIFKIIPNGFVIDTEPEKLN